MKAIADLSPDLRHSHLHFRNVLLISLKPFVAHLHLKTIFKISLKHVFWEVPKLWQLPKKIWAQNNEVLFQEKLYQYYDLSRNHGMQ